MASTQRSECPQNTWRETLGNMLRFRVTADYRVLHWTRMVTLEEQDVGEEEEDLPPDLPAHYFPDEDEDMDPHIYDEDWDMTASFIPV